jgi:hypothetical protein
MQKRSMILTAVFTLLAFVFVLNVASFPLSAAPQTSTERPGAVEKTGPIGKQTGGSSTLTYVLIGAGVLAVAAVLIFVVFKSGPAYDIRGTWTFEYLRADGTVNGGEYPGVVFAGSSTSGTVTRVGQETTFTVSDKTIVIVEVPAKWARHNATFSDNDHFAGTWAYSTGSSGNFRATRTAAAVSAATTGRETIGNPPLDKR